MVCCVPLYLACCLSFVVVGRSWLLMVVCCLVLLLVVCRALFVGLLFGVSVSVVVCRLTLVGRCLLFLVCRLPFVVRRLLCVVCRCSLVVVRCVLLFVV